MDYIGKLIGSYTITHLEEKYIKSSETNKIFSSVLKRKKYMDWIFWY